MVLIGLLAVLTIFSLTVVLLAVILRGVLTVVLTQRVVLVATFLRCEVVQKKLRKFRQEKKKTARPER